MSRPGPKPWWGCDTSSAAWKAYCEAWEHCYRRKDPRIRATIVERRGKDALADLDHNMAVVRADYAGEIENRAEIATRLRL